MLNFFGKTLRRLHEVREDERGFTLIELLVVVAIIAILVAIALPVFLGQRAKAADARAKANVREAATAINVYFTENGGPPAGGPNWGDAGTVLNKSGFSGSTPKVFLTATGTADTAAWCVSTISDGGTKKYWYQNEKTGEPVGTDVAPPAGCQTPT